MIDWAALEQEIYGAGYATRRHPQKTHKKRSDAGQENCKPPTTGGQCSSAYSWREEMARMRAELIGAT